MAGHTVSAGVFKVKDAEPEATLELFSDYFEVMKRVFRLRRRIHLTTGERIEFDDDEKKDLILFSGGWGRHAEVIQVYRTGVRRRHI